MSERPLTAKQRLFVIHFCTCYNATEAAKRAGYSPHSAAEIGWENLRKPQIKKEIEAYMAAQADALHLKPAEVLTVLRRVMHTEAMPKGWQVRVQAAKLLGAYLKMWDKDADVALTAGEMLDAIPDEPDG